MCFLCCTIWDGFFAIPVMILGIATVVSEYYLAIGFWIKKLRIFTSIFGVIFYIILKQVVDVGFLDYVAVFLYLSFILPWEKDRLIQLDSVRIP